MIGVSVFGYCHSVWSGPRSFLPDLNSAFLSIFAFTAHLIATAPIVPSLFFSPSQST